MSSILQELRRRNVLRVGAAYLVFSWLVLQFVDVVFPMLGLDDEVLGRPILIVLLIGLPITLVLAWIFELTPDGIKRDSEIDPDAPVARTKGRVLDRAIIVILLAAVSLLLADRFDIFGQVTEEPSIASSSAGKSVAVLPFVNQSSNLEDAFFADGLTETLLHMLAQIPGLKVPARSSVFAFKDAQSDVREIATSLGVETVLEGSVRRAGDQVRITAQLVLAESGFTLWSKTFDRQMTDIFSVQDEIAASVSEALQVTLLGSETPDLKGVGTNDLFAYEKYLQGLEQKNIASYGSLQAAEGLFKEAISADQTFTEAKIDLALVYKLQAETGLKTQDDATARARALLGQALVDNPNNTRALAHSAITDWQQAIQSLGPTDPATQSALENMREIVARAPNEPALYTALANAGVSEGRGGDTLDWLEKGLQIDPLSARLNLQKGRFLLNFLGRPVDAERAFSKARESAPGWTAVDLASGDAAFSQGEFVTGMQWYVSAMYKDPQDHEIPAMIGRELYNYGLYDLADSMLARAQSIAPVAPRTRGLELEKHLQEGNHERVSNLAVALLMDDVEDRGGAFSLAVFGYVSAMIALDNAEDVPAFFESLRPGVTQATYTIVGQKEFSMRFALVYAFNAVGAYDRSEAILDDIFTWANAVIPEWQQNDYVMTQVHLVAGDLDKAIETAVLDLSQPLGRQKNWRSNYTYFVWMKPLLDHPRVAEKIESLEKQAANAADELEELFAAN